MTILWLAACVQSLCAIDEDCAGGQVCDVTSGACVTPACVTSDDCGDDQVCLRDTCFDVGECETAVAPDFCGFDLNPASPTTSQQVCLPPTAPTAAAVFFGSVECSHCQALFSSLDQMADELQADGVPAWPVFVNLIGREVSPDDVSQAFGTSVQGSVVQDTVEDGIWDSFGAGWYEVAIVDAAGCVVGYYGPLSSDALAGEVGDSLRADWNAAAGAR